MATVYITNQTTIDVSAYPTDTTFVLDAGSTTTAIRFYSSSSASTDVTVDIRVEANPGNTSVTFGGSSSGSAKIDPTVTVNTNIDCPGLNINGSDAKVSEITIKLEDGSSVNNITGASGDNTLTGTKIVAGDHAGFNNYYAGTAKADISMGENCLVTGSVNSGNADFNFSMDDNGEFKGIINLTGGGAKDISLGNGTKFTTTGTEVIKVSTSGTMNVNIHAGDDVNLGGGIQTDLNYLTNAGLKYHIETGKNFTMRDMELGYGGDYVKFGDGWIVGTTLNQNVTLQGGSNTLILGVPGYTSPPTTSIGRVSIISWNSLTDTLIFTDQGMLNAFKAAVNGKPGWSINGDVVSYTNTPTIGTPSVDLGAPYYLRIVGFESVDLICFAAGTLIQTALGDIAIEHIQVGDLIHTKDHGLQPVRWIGSHRLGAADLINEPKLRPIRIRADALGHGLPAQDLLVSPQHRILIRSKIAQKMFGTDEVLVAAKQLVILEGIDVVDDIQEVTYFHMLFTQHEIVWSNGAETESLYTGPEALKALGPAAVEEIHAIFPEMSEPGYVPEPARLLTSGRMARKMSLRHQQNNKPLVRH